MSEKLFLNKLYNILTAKKDDPEYEDIKNVDIYQNFHAYEETHHDCLKTSIGSDLTYYRKLFSNFHKNFYDIFLKDNPNSNCISTDETNSYYSIKKPESPNKLNFIEKFTPLNCYNFVHKLLTTLDSSPLPKYFNLPENASLFTISLNNIEITNIATLSRDTISNEGSLSIIYIDSTYKCPEDKSNGTKYLTQVLHAFHFLKMIDRVIPNSLNIKLLTLYYFYGFFKAMDHGFKEFMSKLAASEVDSDSQQKFYENEYSFESENKYNTNPLFLDKNNHSYLVNQQTKYPIPFGHIDTDGLNHEDNTSLLLTFMPMTSEIDNATISVSDSDSKTIHPFYFALYISVTGHRMIRKYVSELDLSALDADKEFSKHKTELNPLRLQVDELKNSERDNKHLSKFIVAVILCAIMIIANVLLNDFKTELFAYNILAIIGILIGFYRFYNYKIEYIEEFCIDDSVGKSVDVPEFITTYKFKNYDKEHSDITNFNTDLDVLKTRLTNLASALIAIPYDTHIRGVISKSSELFPSHEIDTIVNLDSVASYGSGRVSVAFPNTTVRPLVNNYPDPKELDAHTNLVWLAFHITISNAYGAAKNFLTIVSGNPENYIDQYDSNKAVIESKLTTSIKISEYNEGVYYYRALNNLIQATENIKTKNNQYVGIPTQAIQSKKLNHTDLKHIKTVDNIEISSTDIEFDTTPTLTEIIDETVAQITEQIDAPIKITIQEPTMYIVDFKYTPDDVGVFVSLNLNEEIKKYLETTAANSMIFDEIVEARENNQKSLNSIKKYQDSLNIAVGHKYKLITKTVIQFTLIFLLLSSTSTLALPAKHNLLAKGLIIFVGTIISYLLITKHIRYEHNFNHIKFVKT